MDRSQKVDRSNLESLFRRGKQVSYPDPATTLESLSRIPMTKGMKNTSTFTLTTLTFFFDARPRERHRIIISSIVRNLKPREVFQNFSEKNQPYRSKFRPRRFLR